MTRVKTHTLTSDTELVLRVRRDRVAATPNGHAELFPYFEGYCGIPSSALMYSQRGGAVRNISISRRRRVTGNSILLQYLNTVNINPTTAAHVPLVRRQIRRPSADILVDELTSLSMTEQEILHSLAEGRGITQYDGIGLLESCGSCQWMFAASALWAHIPTCSES